MTSPGLIYLDHAGTTPTDPQELVSGWVGLDWFCRKEVAG